MNATTPKTRLEARVKATNRANEYANELYPMLVKAVSPFVGKKVELQTGGLVMKLRNALPKAYLPQDLNLSVYRYHSDYSLAWTVKTCEVFEGIACYYETTVYVGKLDHGVLTELEKTPHFKTDYNAEGVEAARVAYKEAKKVADDAHSALYPFGEYDR